MKLCRVGIGGAVLLSASALFARGVTFDDRVRAQEAIERVYYAHQLSASRPFEQAVPAEVVRAKVTRALKLSVALERYWKTPVTAAMLDAEVARMRAQTRMPGRLRELFAALDDDPVLIRESLARPALVERLARSFFAAAPPPGAGTWDAWWASVAPSLDPAQVVVDASPPATSDMSVTASCPAPDSWDPGSLDDGPDTRHEATAVWTGSHMIVWGGTRGGATVATGYASNGYPSYDGDGSRFVLDRNGDGISDACDPDDDGDGVPDAQDCAPGDPTVATPGAPILDVRMDGTTLYWSAQDPGTTYDVAWGDLGVLHVTGTSEATCFASYLTQPWVDPLPGPDPGYGAYYLVRAVNVCGNSGWGEPSKPDRDVAACP